jgi:hypothetical protein
MRELCKSKLPKLGIVYPKWTKTYSIDENDLLVFKWNCSYFWSFGKSVDSPKHIEYNLPDNEFYLHTKKCSYKVLNEKLEKVKVPCMDFLRPS